MDAKGGEGGGVEGGGRVRGTDSFFFGYLFTIIGISDRVRHDFQGHRCELC